MKIYGTYGTVEKGTYMNYNYWVVSMGTYPCAYIELPKNDIYYSTAIKGDYDDIPLKVYGGLTYARNYLFNEVENTAIIGWDYAHLGDYHSFMFNSNLNGKKWTITEIRKHIQSAINQLIKKNDDFYKGKKL